MDKLELYGEHLLQPNLDLKTRPKQVLGSLPLEIYLTFQNNKSGVNKLPQRHSLNMTVPPVTPRISEI
jgi:hypothetical protein